LDVDYPGLDVEFRVGDEHELRNLEAESFDVVFSNFGPLNSVYSLQRLAAALHRVVRPGGTLVLSVLGKLCFQEIVFFLATGQVRRTTRRLRSWTTVQMPSGAALQLRFLGPTAVASAFRDRFVVEHVRSLGAIAPASFLDAWLPSLARRADCYLRTLERAAARTPALRWATASIADQFIVTFRAEGRPL